LELELWSLGRSRDGNALLEHGRLRDDLSLRNRSRRDALRRKRDGRSRSRRGYIGLTTRSDDRAVFAFVRRRSGYIRVDPRSSPPVPSVAGVVNEFTSNASARHSGNLVTKTKTLEPGEHLIG
jgi:hypothetical protein